MFNQALKANRDGSTTAYHAQAEKARARSRRRLTHDAWGNPYTYSTGADTYVVWSSGCDGAAGPAPPAVWVSEPCAPDLIVVDGVFSQAPTGQ